MGAIKSLAKDTALYGLSSIIGRFLNWLLVPLYTYKFVESEYGVVSYVYSIVALALVILTYGMETGFFRFANHERYDNPQRVYSTSMISLAMSSTLFFVAVMLCIEPSAHAMQCDGHESFVALMAATVAIDAFTAIPFAWLRYRKRPLRFAMLKLIGIALNIGFNLFFILLCPRIWDVDPGLIEWFYNPDYGIGYIFLSNFIASAMTLLLLLPDITGFRWSFDTTLWREMLYYSWPLLIFGIAGIMNQTIGNIMLPWLATSDGIGQLGIYGANYKIAVVMVMFIQAFRFAYEPFIFAKGKKDAASPEQTKRLFADTMKYFIIFSLVIFLGVMAYIDIVKHLIAPAYYVGLRVVPVVMIAELFFGVFFNLSLWYKLTDRTIWGTWFSLGGLLVTVGMNILLVPRIGYMGCAWAALACYGSMMVASYFVGRRNYPIPYAVDRCSLYFAVAMVCFALMMAVPAGIGQLGVIGVRTLILAAFVVFAVRREKISPTDVVPAALKDKLLRRNRS